MRHVLRASLSLTLLALLSGCRAQLSELISDTAIPSPTDSPVLGCTETFNSPTFTSGVSINGQNGWEVDPAAHFNESIVTLGADACRGTGVWHLSNTVVSSGFGNQPRSKALSESAGESSVRSTSGGDTMEVVFWIKPASLTADGSAVTLSLSPTSADRHNYVRLINHLDAQGGFQIVIIDYQDFDSNPSGRTFLISGIDRAQWTKVRLLSTNPNGSGNDTLALYLNDELQGTYASWEDLRTSPNGFASPTLSVNRVLWRMSALPSSVDASFTNGGAQGFYIDDFSQKIYDASAPSVILESDQTGFEPL